MISEPPCIPNSEGWFGSKDGLAAIYLCDKRRKGRLIKQAENFIVVEWENIYMISVYISPNVDRTDFLIFLDDLGDEVHVLKDHILIGGDFNSKSTHWNCTRILEAL